MMQTIEAKRDALAALCIRLETFARTVIWTSSSSFDASVP
jgi:hypothetical protein